MFRNTFHLLQRLVRDCSQGSPSTTCTNNCLADLEENYLQKFTEFLRLFVSVHLRRFESNGQFPVLEFLALLFKYTFQQPNHEGYFSCLEIWAVLLDYLSSQLNVRPTTNGSVIEKYKDALVALVTEIQRKYLFRFNQANLEELDDDSLNDDSETEWQHFLRQCLEIVAKVAELFPEDTFRIIKHCVATEYHLGVLKAKLAKYRHQLMEPTGKKEKGEGFDVMKSGDARVALIGFPSVGKSTLLNVLTSTHSESASYEFTTLTCIPGVIEYQGANIQLLDLPGIIEGAAQGKGRGRQVIAVARTADLVVIMLDATKGDVQKELLEGELEAVGIRLNKKPPNIYFKIKKGGGIGFNATCTLTKCDEKLVQMILHEYKIFNAEVLFRDDCNADELIDVIVGSRVYLPCLYVYNKIDQISIEEVDRIARTPHSVVVSCNMKLNLDYLLEMIWEHLALIRVYTKKRGDPPDFDGGMILRKASSVEHVCHSIHRNIVHVFKYALVWGTSTKYSPQRVGLQHIVHHEDVIQVVKK